MALPRVAPRRAEVPATPRRRAPVRVRGCLWCLDGPDDTERGLLDQLGTVAGTRGVPLSDFLPELRAAYHQARATHDERTEHYAWAAIRAITALTPTGETGVSLSDAVPLRVLAVSGVA